MIWRSTAMILTAFLVCALAVWFAPFIVGLSGLGEFVFVGQICLPILALSALEAVFTRLPGSSADHETGHEVPDL